MNHYETLGVKENATKEEIKKAYRILALHFHPDKSKNKDLAEIAFLKIKNAYEVLADDNKRAYYDAQLKNNLIKADTVYDIHSRHYKNVKPEVSKAAAKMTNVPTMTDFTNVAQAIVNARLNKDFEKEERLASILVDMSLSVRLDQKKKSSR